MGQMVAEKGDITTYRVDAIVNAANPFLERGGGVCGAIFRAAGAEELETECSRIMEKRNHEPLKHGECAITSGCRLAAKYVIHAVGPIWEGGGAEEEQTLEKCYRNILRLCAENGIKSVAISAISTGIYGFPLRRATEIAVGTVREFLKLSGGDLVVKFVCFDEGTLEVYQRALKAVC
jgi:O-acetyl-ADP-ribose deacetylase (regulator of RNase III)